MRPTQYWNICSTFYYKTEEDIEIIKKFFREFCRYGVFGKEICPTTQRPHLQMYMELSRQMTISSIHKKLSNLSQPIAEIKTRFGTAMEAAGYCKKGTNDRPQAVWQEYFNAEYEGYEHGEISKQGRRIDIEELIEKVISGELTLEEILVEMPMKYHQYTALSV